MRKLLVINLSLHLHFSFYIDTCTYITVPTKKVFKSIIIQVILFFREFQYCFVLRGQLED